MTRETDRSSVSRGGGPGRLGVRRCGALAWQLVGGAVGGLTASAVPGLAQKQPRYDETKQYGAVSVSDTDRPLFKPDGLRMGNFIFSPEVGYAIGWSDNIRGTPTDRTGGFRHTLSSGLKITSDLPRHMIELMLSGRGVAVQDHSDMNFLDGRAAVRWRLDLDRGHNIFGSAMHERVHEEAVTFELPSNASKPIEVVRTRLESGFTRDVGKLAFSAGARFEQWNFKDVEAYSGSILDQDHRDISILSPFVRLAYRPSPGYRLLAEGELNFQRAPGNGAGTDHDGRGYRLLAGVEMELSPLVRLTLKGGHAAMQFDNPGLQSASTPIGEARVQWLATPRLTFNAGIARTLESTTIAGTSAREATKAFLGADAELLHNLVVRAELEHRWNSYVGSEFQDRLSIGRIGAEYALTQNWNFMLGYEHRIRSFSQRDADTVDNRVTFGAKYRY